MLFFAISGFVIPSSLRAVGHQTTLDALRVFFIRRVFRLYPAYWISVFGAALLGLFILLSTKLQINNRFTTWLGEISYSMYLLHPIVVYTLFVLLRDQRMPWLANAHLSVYLLLFMLGSVAIAAIIYYGVEKPMIRLGRRLSTN